MLEPKDLRDAGIFALRNFKMPARENGKLFGTEPFRERIYVNMAKALNPVHIVTAKKIHSAQAAKVISLAEMKSRIVSKGGLNRA